MCHTKHRRATPCPASKPACPVQRVDIRAADTDTDTDTEIITCIVLGGERRPTHHNRTASTDAASLTPYRLRERCAVPHPCWRENMNSVYQIGRALRTRRPSASALAATASRCLPPAPPRPSPQTLLPRPIRSRCRRPSSRRSTSCPAARTPASAPTTRRAGGRLLSRPCRIHLSPASDSHGILDDGLRRGDGAGFASFVRVGKTCSKQARHAASADKA